MGRVKDYYWDEINQMLHPDPYISQFYSDELDAYEQYCEQVTKEVSYAEDYRGYAMSQLSE